MSLLNSGHKVTMLDAGLKLENDRRKLVDEMKGVSKTQWTDSHLKRIKENMAPSGKGLPLKYIYGSDFPYRDAADRLSYSNFGSAAAASLARAGFSNVWGAGILPLSPEELASWPVDAGKFENYYREVLKFVPMSASEDRLAARFPLFSTSPQRLNLSRQGEKMIADFDKASEVLSSCGISFGRARLAVRSLPGELDDGCAYCGLCMYGCPYELIYSTDLTLKTLLTHPSFDYLPGWVCTKVVEDDTRVVITSEDMSGKNTRLFKATRVFLACGALSTTKILMESLERYDVNLQMLDSQYFLIPLIRYKGTSNASKEQLHTLAQLFLEIDNFKISNHMVHLSVYTYNELFKDAILKMFGPTRKIMRGIAENVAGRFVLCGGYLHSDESSKLNLRLQRSTKPGEKSRLLIESLDNLQIRKRVNKVARLLFQVRNQIKAVPISFMTQIQPPGRGFHIGGSFPMSKSPTRDQSDTIGRPFGLDRVHAVDSTVFPSIPSGPITLTVMANAYRIAAAVPPDNVL
jgi:choline dehydrogenase-like flavoprotein